MTFSSGPCFLEARQVGGVSGLTQLGQGPVLPEPTSSPSRCVVRVCPSSLPQQKSAGKRGAAFAIGVCLQMRLLVVRVRLVSLLFFSCRLSLEECAAELGFAWPRARPQ